MTFADLTPGTVVLYNDASNVDRKFTVVCFESDHFGEWVELENENGGVERMKARTTIQGLRWTVAPPAPATEPTNQKFRTAKTKLLVACRAKSTQVLKESAKLLMADTGADATMALLAILDVLETRMNENEFVAFCDNL